MIAYSMFVVFSFAPTAFVADESIEDLRKKLAVAERRAEVAERRAAALETRISELERGSEEKKQRKSDARKPLKNSLSEALQPGAVFEGTFRTLNKKPQFMGKVWLSIRTRKGNRFTAEWKTTSPGKPGFEREVEGVLKDDGKSVDMAVVNDPLPPVMSGSRKDGYLNLIYKGPWVTSAVTLKIPD